MDFQPPPVDTPDVPVDTGDGGGAVVTDDGPEPSDAEKGQDSVGFDGSLDPSVSSAGEQQEREAFSPAEDPSVETEDADPDQQGEAFSPAEDPSVETDDAETGDDAPKVAQPAPEFETTSDADQVGDHGEGGPEPIEAESDDDGGHLVALSQSSNGDDEAGDVGGDDEQDGDDDGDAGQRFLDVINHIYAPFGIHLAGPEPTRSGAIVLDHGGSRAKQTLSPDGTNSFTSPAGSTVTVRPDGDVVVSDGVRMRTTVEGDIEARTPDGYTATASRQGDLWVESPDGSVCGMGSDGTLSISDEGWSVVSTPDGSNSTETVMSPDGTGVSWSTDGTRSIMRPDGSATTVHRDGTVVNALSDGSVAVKHPDGEVSVTTPNGVTTVIKPNGDVAVYDADSVSYPLDDEPGLVPVDTPDVALIKGAADSVRETVEFFWRLSPLRGLIDRDGYDRDVDNLVAGVRYAVMNPIEAVQRGVEDAVEAFATDPFRAAGKLLTDLALGGPIGKADDVADVGRAGGKLADAADAADAAKSADKADNAADVARTSSRVVDAADGNDRPHMGAARSEGLTPDETDELARIRTEVFNLPIRPTDAKPAIVGVLVLETGERLPIHSGKFGGPWGGTHRGGIPRGEGSGFTGHTLTHVEGHAAAIMHQRGIQKATLIIEKMPCGACDNPGQRPNVTAMLPAGAELTLVDPDAAGIYRSVQP